MKNTEKITALTSEICELLKQLKTDDRTAALNGVRRQLHEVSPFKDHPVDLVLWQKADTLSANDYNPNAVAPPEMALLKKSITEDGYTQPIVTWRHTDGSEVVDGYHRYKSGTSSPLADTLHGYLPVTEIRAEKTSREARMASTIRHNRARGSHAVELMINIVAELTEAGMSDAWIMKSIGMDADELLRLKQISGLISLFSDTEFSTAWVKGAEEEKFYQFHFIQTFPAPAGIIPRFSSPYLSQQKNPPASY